MYFILTIQEHVGYGNHTILYFEVASSNARQDKNAEDN